MSATLRVCETFVSIQGESTHAGQLCCFIRLTGCNLRCSYCDTAYAYEDGSTRTVADVVAEFRASGVPLAEVTGGEPLLQAATPELLMQLSRHGAVLLETNGSCDIGVVPEGVITILDIKCPGSGATADMRWENIAKLRRHDEVKFVIDSRSDYEWACRTVTEHRLAERCHAVLFSPVWGRVQPEELAGWMIADRTPARFNLQLHKVIWPAHRRGV